MKKFLVSFLIAVNLFATIPAMAGYGVQTKIRNCTANQVLQDSTCTPGAVLTTKVSVICKTGYTKTVRNVSLKVRKQVFAEYGISYSQSGKYEVDHLISLELGGSNDISNLWPESYGIINGARIKDKLENYLHAQICSGKITVVEAQKEISTDWLKYYLVWKGGWSLPISIVTPSSTLPTSATSTVTESVSPQTTTANPSIVQYYTSSYSTTKYYYPASCSAWKSLSPNYLKSFGSLVELLSAYPSRTLSPQCH